jgi:SAM-dependent methyltransferase
LLLARRINDVSIAGYIVSFPTSQNQLFSCIWPFHSFGPFTALPSTNMALNTPKESESVPDAYSNADWAEFYDLMVEEYFGNQPSQDAALFFRILKSVQATIPEEEAVTILDIGAGTGRVIIQLLESIARAKNDGSQHGELYSSFHFIAEDNGQAMLDRARHIIEPLRDYEVQEMRLALGDRHPVDFSFDTICDSATELGVRYPKILAPDGVHLALFAAGGLTHITEDGGISSFLARLRDVLNPQGRAVISILKEFLKGDGGVAGNITGDGVVEEKGVVLRLGSKERTGQIYAKYPTDCIWHGDFRTDILRLDVEDNEGKVIKSSKLKWDVKFIGVEEWEAFLNDTGFEIEEKVNGDIQVWWVLKRRH